MNFKYLNFSLLTALLLAGSSLGAASNIPWVLNGNALPNSPGRVVLTSASANQAGSMWNPCSIDLSSSFDMDFVMNFGNNLCGGDGIAFVLQSSAAGTAALGSNAGDHGYSGAGITQSLAVVFDTNYNPSAPYFDPSYYYDSLDLNLGGSAAYAGPSACSGTGQVSGPCPRPAISSSQAIVKDGLDHAVEIKWDPSTFTITVLVDGLQSASWVLPSDYVSSVFGGGSSVYYGFTASTGGSYNYQQVAQTSINPGSGACAATPVILQTATPIVLPANPCPPSFTATPSQSASATRTPTAGAAATATQSRTSTLSATQTPTNTAGAAATATQSRTSTLSATQTPTSTSVVSTPTDVPALCGPAPAFVQSAVLNGSGCLGSGNPTSWAYTVPAGVGQVLIVQVEAGSTIYAGPATFNGISMIPLPSDSALAITGGGNLYSYYMVNPAAGSGVVAVPGATGCSWNVVATLYSHVDTANPIGSISTHGGNNATFSDSIATGSGFSIIHDFFAYPSGPVTFSGSYGTGLFDPSTSQCCDDVYGSYLNTVLPGAYSNNYGDPSGPTNWTGVSIELRALSACNTATATSTKTPSPSPTPTRTAGAATSTPTATASPSLFSPTPTPHYGVPPTDHPGDPGDTDSFCYPDPIRRGPGHFVFRMLEPGKSHIRVYLATGAQAGGYSQEHGQAGIKVVVLDLAEYAPGVYFYLVDRIYLSGAKNTTKLQKFIVIR